ncbi:hypothetical protein CesoFtcFv8_008356 [Champsocephalus esox]|uniref:Uncharacterized protein n=2 Tax=Champsocephalus TaxID=52236 RepID=A0AAN8DPJ1_CHAGU|nr:hypothetical protein CesoFtcFv8_008356 [Champsocephalus esox]KAK5925934.1 hypothetical protein CgunFtcFv8_021548 [Champsocephalus gunnari]
MHAAYKGSFDNKNPKASKNVQKLQYSPLLGSVLRSTAFKPEGEIIRVPARGLITSVMVTRANAIQATRYSRERFHIQSDSHKRIGGVKKRRTTPPRGRDRTDEIQDVIGQTRLGDAIGWMR